MNTNTDTLIEMLVDAQCGDVAAARQRHVLRQSLYGLVHLAQAEQRLAMRLTVHQLVGNCRLSTAELGDAGSATSSN